MQELALENGLYPWIPLLGRQKAEQGDKILVNHRDKALIMFVIGREY